MRGQTYGFGVEVALTTSDAEARVRSLLKEQGFGVLTEIDVRATLRDRLGVEFRPYKILGACNPSLAHSALQTEPQVGLLLPCNVVVEEGSQGTTRVTFLDPSVALGIVGNEGLTPIASDASKRLHRVADRLRESGAEAAGRGSE